MFSGNEQAELFSTQGSVRISNFIFPSSRVHFDYFMFCVIESLK
jgi:hypothetical protein